MIQLFWLLPVFMDVFFVAEHISAFLPPIHYFFIFVLDKWEGSQVNISLFSTVDFLSGL